ncbi:MAG: AroB-related putative sugar phosphate phospholyase (cyclizing) [Thermodesulfobacteriota bacterium]
MPEPSGFSVKSLKRDYSVSFVDDFAAALASVLRPGDTLLVDQRLAQLYAGRLEPLLAGQPHLLLAASEEQKEFSRLGEVITFLVEKGFRKNHCLVAVGGGVIQDITGFVASILFRGVEWLFAPSTLLAQCDSCIGSKTSLNLGPYKNQLGTFYPPSAIFIDTSLLNSLGGLEMRSGLGEMIHYFLVNGRDDFEFIRDHYDACLRDKAALRRAIARSLGIKRAMIERDEFDQGPRQVFNYGHSFGHAIETLTDYAIPHGVAVCFGMDLANFLSVRLGYINEELRQELRPLLAKNWGQARLSQIEPEALIQALGKDKKNEGSQIKVILTKGLGQMFKTTLEVDDKCRGWLREYFNQAAKEGN